MNLRLLLIAAALAAPVAHACDPRAYDFVPFFKAADTNHDGRLTQQEYLAARFTGFEFSDQWEGNPRTPAAFARVVDRKRGYIRLSDVGNLHLLLVDPCAGRPGNR